MKMILLGAFHRSVQTLKMRKTKMMFYPAKIRPLFFFFLVIALLWGCYPTLKKEAQVPHEALRQTQFFYPTFSDDMDMASLALAVQRNLVYLNRLDAARIFQYGPHAFSCQQVRESQEFFLSLISKGLDRDQFHKAIKKHYRIYRATGRTGNKKVLFTGYYEPVYQGSLTPDQIFKYPIYQRPDDLLKIDLSPFNDKFKGQSVIARIDGQKILPYYTRYQIEMEKVLAGKNLEIAWLKDPLDVSFLHIQGSGRLKLHDESSLLVGYQISNGRPYRSIGNYMLQKKLLSRKEMSMQAIRKYLYDHPENIDEILNYNPSYVFFRKLNDGPFGNINVPLTPGRSLALDARLFPKGALAFISCQKPLLDAKGGIATWTKFSRFVLNQDTGGAIKGAGRADIYWGSGPYAETAAGHLKHEGDLYILIKESRGKSTH